MKAKNAQPFGSKPGPLSQKTQPPCMDYANKQGEPGDSKVMRGDNRGPGRPNANRVH